MDNRFFKSNKAFEDFTSNISKNAYRSSTNGINIFVESEFLDMQIDKNLFIFAYHIKIENKSDQVVKLINRHWRILDEKGLRQEVDGEGVVGKQPVIAPNEYVEYTSGVHLNCSSGIMNGHYDMQGENGEVFAVEIPSFSLDVPFAKRMVN
jgi:ApaG protein